MKKIFIILFILFIACGIKQPVEIKQEIAKGKIYVTSNPSTAKIYLDGQLTTKTTPDTLTAVAVGSHKIQVIKEGYTSKPDSIEIVVEKNKTHTIEFILEKLKLIGYIYIETTPENGEVFVNDLPTGIFTPDTLQITPGEHNIEIRKNGYKTIFRTVNIINDSLIQLYENFEINQRILFELFSNVSCTPCVDAATNIHQFVNEYDNSEFAIIDYFANWPSPNDPFYQASKEDVDERVMYYYLTTLPTLKINGDKEADSRNYTDLINVYQNVKNVHNSQIGLSIGKNLTDGTLHVDIEIYNFENSLDDAQLKLFVALIENDIHFNSPPGTNGLKDFTFVFRGFLTPNTGDEILSSTNIKNISYSSEFLDCNYSNSQVIAFIQNIITKKIIQSSIK